MAVRCAHSIADFSEKRGITPDNIIATMEETDVFAVEAADVAMQAISEGVARVKLGWQDVHDRAAADIKTSRAIIHDMMKAGHIKEPPEALLKAALDAALAAVA
jgi:malate dehydrogenase (oxaloacetate-decarboxylating)